MPTENRCAAAASVGILAMRRTICRLSTSGSRILRVGVERRQRGDRRDEHAHRVRVVVEALQEALPDVLVDEGVVGDLGLPGVELRRRRQLPVEQEVGHLEVRRVLGELLDRVAPVLQDADVAVHEGDGALARGRGREARVVEPDPREQLRELRGTHPTELDGDLDRAARSVVGDRDALTHRTASLDRPSK